MMANTGLRANVSCSDILTSAVLMHLKGREKKRHANHFQNHIEITLYSQFNSFLDEEWSELRWDDHPSYNTLRHASCEVQVDGWLVVCSYTFNRRYVESCLGFFIHDHRRQSQSSVSVWLGPRRRRAPNAEDWQEITL